MKKLCKLMTIFGLLLIIPVAAAAHTLWINATDFTPELRPRFGAATITFFGYGHRYPVADFLEEDHLAKFQLVKGEDKKDLKPNPGGFLATEIKFKEAGAYIVSAALKPGYYTMNMENGRPHHHLKPMTGLDNVFLSLYYEQYSKALISVGETAGDAFSQVLGDKMEIIPQQNPCHLKPGDILEIKVLLSGKAAPFCWVHATYDGFSNTDDFAFATKTNAEGMAKVRILRYGNQLIKVDKKQPASSAYAKKCIEEHYTATMTFEIK
ncbi:MAG TPA: DUF4198 domain-containing protein [Proteobacteria bacterium]|nr:DUF4198 domain-containing protein [Pseudomonadota bacterium]